MTGVPINGKFEHRRICTKGTWCKDDHVMLEEETKLKQLQAKEHQGLPATTRS